MPNVLDQVLQASAMNSIAFAGLSALLEGRDDPAGFVRAYHNSNHVARIFELAIINPRENTYYDLNLIARFALFHDIVMGRKNPTQNEYLSAQCYNIYEDLALPITATDQVAAAIIATSAHHEYRPWLSPFIKYCLDLDLYDIGTERYWTNNGLLYQEAESMGACAEDILKGRIAWIDNMLTREKIFYDLTNLEKQARYNLEQDRDRLSMMVSGHV